jgi:hypothetical protein
MVTPFFPLIVFPVPAAEGKLVVPNLSTETSALVKPDNVNAPSPIVASGGMVMEVKADALSNALFPMLVN